MRNKILPFLLGVFVMLSIAATVPNSILTFKPAKPASTISYCGQSPDHFTQKWAAKGYQVVSSASQGYYNTYVVMVKY